MLLCTPKNIETHDDNHCGVADGGNHCGVADGDNRCGVADDGNHCVVADDGNHCVVADGGHLEFHNVRRLHSIFNNKSCCERRMNLFWVAKPILPMTRGLRNTLFSE